MEIAEPLATGAVPNMYSCIRCGYHTGSKYNMFRHINREFSCDPLVKDVDAVELLNMCPELVPAPRQLVEKKFECEFCDAKYVHQSALSRHLHGSCKNRAGAIRERINALMLRNVVHDVARQVKEELRVEQTNNNNDVQAGDSSVVNVVNGTHNNIIVINSYGNESLDHLTDAFKTQCIRRTDKGFVELIERIHFDMHKPENANVRATNIKQNVIQTHDGTQWNYQKKCKVLEDLVEKGHSILTEHYDEYEELITQGMSTTMRTHINNWIDSLEDRNKRTLESLATSIYLLILNKSK